MDEDIVKISSLDDDDKDDNDCSDIAFAIMEENAFAVAFPKGNKAGRLFL